MFMTAIRIAANGRKGDPGFALAVNARVFGKEAAPKT